MIVRDPLSALEDLKDNLASPTAINDALDFLQTLNGHPKPTMTDNLLDFVLHEKDGFDPEIHFTNNRSRFWTTMSKAFNEHDLAQYNITEASCSSCTDKTAMLRTMLLSTVIQSLEQKYIMQDRDKYNEELQAFALASRNMTPEQEQHYADLSIKIRAPFTRQQRFAANLGELIDIIDKTISDRQQLLKKQDMSAALLKESKLPEKIKQMIANTITELISVKNGLSVNESDNLIQAINDFIAKPNETNRQALNEFSSLLSTRNNNKNAMLENISASLFSLSLVSLKSSSSSTLYGANSKRDAEDNPTLTPKNSPRLD